MFNACILQFGSVVLPCDLKHEITGTRLTQVLSLFFILLSGVSDLQAATSTHLRDTAKFSLELDNDIFYGSDNQFSNGWNFRMQSPRISQWQQLKQTPQWAIRLPQQFKFLQGNNLSKRISLSVGQVINTPANIKSLERIEDDVPYVGLLAGQLSWTVFNNLEMRSAQVTIGMTGRSSMAEQSQNIVHELTGSDLAQGWDHQIRDELAINFNILDKRKIFEKPAFKKTTWDMSFSRGAGIGTIFTLLETGLDLRFGSNMPGGFAPIPNVVGRGVAYDASSPPKRSNKASYYASLNVSANYFFHHLFLQGSLFSDNHGDFVDTKPLIGTLDMGLHYETPNWGAHINWVIGTDTIDVDELYNSEDKRNRYLSFTFEWKFVHP